MGLDGHLYKFRYVKNWDHYKPEERTKVTVEKNNKIEVLPKAAYIFEEVMSWRKANQIHNWFVENVQGGVDNCASYYVSRETLVKLLNTLEKVEKDRGLADTLLPTMKGFFFGSIKYDASYFVDVIRTKEKLKNLLAETAQEEVGDDFVYESSW